MNKIFALFVLFACCVLAAEPIEDWSSQKGDVVHFGSEKEFKKFIKKNENTLVMFYAPWCGHCKSLKPIFSEAATKVKSDKKAAGDKKGPGHYGAVDCTKLADLCQTYDVKGYPTLKMFSKEGETVTDYQRPRSLFELTKFVRPESATEAPAATGGDDATPPKKPEGDDWASTPSDVNHLTEESFEKFLADNDKVLVMFYAPWCGHCKNFKPAYTEAAAEVKKAGTGALAAVDCTQHEKVCSKFDVRGYPTVKYFNKGKVQADYSRPRSRDDVVRFMASPPAENEKPTPRTEEKKPAPAADDWSNTPSDVNHLTDDTFDRFLADNEKTLVMFYAPWCGHCKNFKPAYTEAAAEVKKAGTGALAAVDCTQNDKVCQKYEVRGYPTVKYFNKGKAVADYARQRTKDEVVKFMAASPTENEKPAPQVGGGNDAPNADDWSSVPSDVVHLDEAKFDAYVSANSPVLVMFYAPWCGHCKNLKPAYTEAAQLVKSSGKGSLAAVDCTKSQNLCQKYAVRSYPTVKYFKNGQDFIDFSGQRTKDGLVNFMGKEPEAPWKSTPSDVIHATDADFDTLLQTKAPALVMFYAPWCGHCKSFKPAFQEAATTVKKAGTGNLIAVDCTREKQTCNKQEVKSYPTIKYFTSASESVPFEAERNAASVVAYMASGGKNVPAAAPAAAAAPKAQEEKKAADVWTDAGSEHVTHLNGDTFADHIANNPESVVMFYAPWCGHCKKMKPAYSEAASKLTTEGHKGSLAAVDCTVHPELCQKYGVRGYPTLKHFSKGQVTEEKVGRATSDLYDFIKGKVTIAVDAAKDIVNDAKDAANDAKDVVIDVAKDAKQAVQNRVDEAKDIAKEKVDAVKDAAKAAVEDAKAKMDDVKGGVKAAVEDAKAKVEDVKDAAKEQAKKVKKAVQDAKDEL